MIRRLLGRTGRLKKYLIVALVSTLVAAGTTGVLLFTNSLSAVPAFKAKGLGLSLSPLASAFAYTWITVFSIGVMVILLGPRMRQKAQRMKQFWADLPNLPRAIVFGVLVAAVAGASVAVTDVYRYAIPNYFTVMVFFLVWVLAAFLTFRHLVERDELLDWSKAFAGGAVLGSAVAVSSYLLDVYFYEIPDYSNSLVFLLGWPLATFWVLRNMRREGEGLLSKLLVKVGYAQMKKVETATVALLVGFFAALVAGVTARYFGTALDHTVFAFVGVWLLGTIVTSRRYQAKSDRRTDLVITNVRERESSPSRELSVRNDGDEPVDLTKAKIRDTGYNLYRLDEVELGAGESRSFDIPPEFSLEPESEDVGLDMPMGYSVRQGAEAVVIYTRNGDEYALQWTEEVESDDVVADDPDDRGAEVTS